MRRQHPRRNRAAQSCADPAYEIMVSCSLDVYHVVMSSHFKNGTLRFLHACPERVFDGYHFRTELTPLYILCADGSLVVR
jgi:hypothetical protein